MSVGNFSTLMLLVAEGLALEWERLLLTTPPLRFTAYGALAFDADVRGVSALFLAPSAYRSKERFARLVQVSTVLGVEGPAELAELWPALAAGGGGGGWRLSASQAKRLLGLRVDLAPEEVRDLKL